MELKLFLILTFLTIAQCKLIRLSCNQIRAFVDGHNARRLLLAQGKVPGQPAATDMKSVVWDEELQAKAAKWALKNIKDHNPDRSVPSRRFSVGENLHWLSTTDEEYELDPDSAVESWFNENENFTYGPLQKSDFDGSNDYQIGHYTQVAWSNSVYIGCAILQTFKNGWNKFYVVCNYGPGGNFVDETPYRANGRGSGKLKCGVKDCRRPYGRKCRT